MYFVLDTTRIDKASKQDYLATFKTVPELILYLEGFVQRKFNLTRKEFIQEQSDFHGFSENTDTTFYDMIKNHKILMGKIRNGNLVECDVIRESFYSSKSEHGD